MGVVLIWLLAMVAGAFDICPGTPLALLIALNVAMSAREVPAMSMSFVIICLDVDSLCVLDYSAQGARMSIQRRPWRRRTKWTMGLKVQYFRL